MSSNLQALFHRAVELAEKEREELLADLHRSDTVLARQLHRLLNIDKEGRVAFDCYYMEGDSATFRVVLPDFLPNGYRLGAYEVQDLVGSGGMGNVYRATRCDEQVEQTVAIKLVRPDRIEPAVLARFSSERRMLASLRHHGICAFLDAGTTAAGIPYVVMEYVEGETLLEYCDRRCLDLKLRLLLFRQVLAAVVHAHSRLVVHRDIKNSNVLVTSDGETKLVDFGIGKSLAGTDVSVTATADRFLTPCSAAPELLLGENTGVACDIYALGALAYELLSGSTALQLGGLNGVELENRVLSVQPRPMSHAVDPAAAMVRGATDVAQLARRLRGDLDAIILRCLHKQASGRYGSVVELDDDIARFLEKKPIRARGGDRLYSIRRFITRHKAAAILTSMLTLALLLGSAGLAWQAVELTRQRNAAMLERGHAEQIISVLHETFLAADPARVAGAEVRLRDVLDAARVRLVGFADQQPGLFVKLSDTLASVELAMASETHAADLAMQGISIAEALSYDSQSLLNLRLTAARALAGQGDYQAAYGLLQAIPASEHTRPAWLVARGRVALADFDLEAAIDHFHRAVSQLGDVGPDDEMANYARWQLAEALRRSGRTKQALDFFDEILTWQLRELSIDHPRVMLTRLRRTSIVIREEVSDDQLLDIEQIVGQATAIYGENSSMAGLARSRLATALEKRGQRELAAHQYRLAWAAWRRALGDGHANTLRLGQNLAMALAEDPAGLGEAETILRHLLGHAQDQFALDRPLLVFIRTSLVNVLRRSGQWREALALAASEAAAHGPSVSSMSNKRFQLTEIRHLMEAADCRQPVRGLREDCTAAMSLATRLEH